MSSYSLWFTAAMVFGLGLSLVTLGWLSYRAVGGHLPLIVATLAGVVFVLGLAFALQVVRASADLAERRSAFVLSVTHELKTPVAVVRAAAETLLAGRITDPAVSREYAQLLVDQATRLTRLLDNLLAYARITDIADVYAFQAVSLASLVDQTLRDFRSQLDAASFAVDVQIPSDLPPVRADRTALGLVLDNLVDNAIRYSDRRQELKIVAHPGPTTVRLEVIDRGSGIPQDEIAKVTQRFYRGHPTTGGGSGLGLAIAARIVADHGGLLGLQSVMDQGTTVSVSLPISTERS